MGDETGQPVPIPTYNDLYLPTLLASLDKEIRRSSGNQELRIRRGSDPAYGGVHVR